MDLSLLKQKFQGEVTTNSQDLEKFSTDASIFKIVPEAVVSPKHTDDVKELVKFVSSQKSNQPELSITPRAGGTDMTGGSINDSIIIDSAKHLNQIGEITNDYAWTQPGVMFRDFEIPLLARNRIMPAFPVSKSLCAVGGMVGNNAGGEKTFSYGQVINFVEELEVVLADGNQYRLRPLNEQELQNKLNQQNFEGEFYRKVYELIKNNYRLLQEAKPTTSKNSSGYFLWDVWDGKTFDLTKLFVGSQGTLGVITNIKWRLVPVQRYSKLVVFFLKDLKEIGHVVSEVTKIKPESFEIFDKHTMRMAVKYLPEMIRKMKGNRLKLLWQFLPDIFTTITNGLPEVVLLAEFTGENQKEVDERANNAFQIIHDKFKLPARIAISKEEAEKYWAIRRESYNLLRQHNVRKISAPFIEDIVVHPDQLPQFMPELDAILSNYPNFIYTIAVHAGDANFHIIPLVDVSLEKNRKDIIKMSDEVFNLVLKYKGSMTAEHNDGLVRGPFLKHMFGDQVFALFKQVKQIFDPQNIFNPHKKTEADLDYFSQNLKHHP